MTHSTDLLTAARAEALVKRFGAGSGATEPFRVTAVVR
jgi:hypothetical protein